MQREAICKKCGKPFPDDGFTLCDKCHSEWFNEFFGDAIHHEPSAPAGEQRT